MRKVLSGDSERRRDGEGREMGLTRMKWKSIIKDERRMLWVSGMDKEYRGQQNKGGRGM